MFSWSGMKKDVADFVYSCLTCHKSKIEYQKPFGLMQPLSISKWKWDMISMDFVLGFLNKMKDYLIWVVVHRLTKLAHIILIKTSYSLQKLEEVYISEIGKGHGIPSNIISDRVLRFTSRF